MTQAAQPLVSIIVPVYNVERYVDECLASIRAQTYANLEILLVEDCSTDGSLAKLQPHLADPRVRLIQHERNSGLSAARNTGIEAAKGDFVLFVDSDDTIAAGLVEVCVVQASATDADVVVFDFMAFQDGEPLPEVGTDVGSTGSRELSKSEFFKRLHFAWLKFIRAEVLLDPRLRFPVQYYYEDWPFHWELGFSAASIVSLDGSWYCYRQRESSITASTGKKLLDQFSVQERVLQTVRARGGSAEATVLFSKAHGTFWGILTGIDVKLLPQAVAAAQKLRKQLQTLGPQPPRGVRAVVAGLLLSLPGPLAGAGFATLRMLKLLAKAASAMRDRDGVRSAV